MVSATDVSLPPQASTPAFWITHEPHVPALGRNCPRARAVLTRLIDRGEVTYDCSSIKIPTERYLTNLSPPGILKAGRLWGMGEVDGLGDEALMTTRGRWCCSLEVTGKVGETQGRPLS